MWDMVCGICYMGYVIWYRTNCLCIYNNNINYFNFKIELILEMMISRYIMQVCN